jgi:hypothetical protein
MAAKLFPSRWMVDVVEQIGTNEHVAREFAAEFQSMKAAFDADARQAEANAASVAAATRTVPGFETFGAIRGWPYR